MITRGCLVLLLVALPGCGDDSDTPDVPGDPDATPDATPAEMPVACVDPITDLYTTPADLAAFSPGDVIKCAPDIQLTRSEAQTALASAGVVTVSAQNGVDLVRVAYRTRRAPGVIGLGSAMVYLPSPRPAESTPFVVFAHGTMGLADHCAPSRTTSNDYLALPLAATGTPVIAPDYAGLGTEGVQGYLASRDTAHSIIDAAQAMWNLRGQITAIEPRYAVVGHSQGGSAALSAQGLDRSAGGEPELVGVVALAPGLWSYTDTPSPAPWRNAPLTSTAIGSGIFAAAAVLYLYADAANTLGLDQAGAWFHPSLRSTLEQVVDESCVLDIAATVPLLTPTFDGLYPPGFTAGVASCLEGGACMQPHADFADRLRENFLPIDAQGADILMIQGLFDPLATPDLASCYVTAMQQMSAPLQLCVDSTDHATVAFNNFELFRDWLTARFSGQPPPMCSSLSLPPCSQ